MKVYAISGLGADERVFKFLNLEYPIEVIQWNLPEKNESLNEYAERLSEQIDLNNPFILIGVSFGGMIAVALQSSVNPVLTILISSAANKFELPYLYRIVGKMKILKCLPPKWFKLPNWFAIWLFATKNGKMLNAIINDTDVNFLKWAAIAITSWDEERVYKNLVKIHGTKDRVIPMKTPENRIVILGGGHLMIIDNAKELSQIINEEINRNTYET